MTITRTKSEDETAAVGRRLGRALAPGSVVLISGPLGAGKTAFVRGLAEGLGCDGAAVSSPTFTIVQEYVGTDCRLEHVDLYRLTPAEVDDLGLDDLMPDAVLAVEWPEHWPTPPAHAVRVAIATGEGTDRVLTIDGPGIGSALGDGAAYSTR